MSRTTREEVGRQWGNDLAYPHREAVIYHNHDRGLYEVEFYERGKLLETRDMVTNNPDWGRCVHSLDYAESAAENFCLGYMAKDGMKKNDTLFGFKCLCF